MSDLENSIRDLALAAKDAARTLATLGTDRKNAALVRAASLLRSESVLRDLLAANAKDVAAAQGRGLAAPLVDRLRLDAKRIEGIAKAVDDVVALPDPVGRIAELKRLPNGLEVGKMRVPLGLIAIVYESRPNVTSDAAALCLKSGNACILRGGSEAIHSNRALAAVYAQALSDEGLPPTSVTLVPTTEREATLALVGLSGIVDLAIPRGGEGLIRFVTENARVPVIQHYKGVCHVYVDGDADLDMALAIALNSKTHRPGVCNAMETLIVDAACAEHFLPRAIAELRARGVEVRGGPRVREVVTDVEPTTDEDWDTEYLDLVLSIGVVDGIDGALTHIRHHGTQHTEAIVTSSYDRAQRFLREVDASLVLVNASTRFNDGGELGLGAEIGISTTKMHAYGPMGLEELCSSKWIGYGSGQIRK